MADLLFVFLETKQVQITEVKDVEKNKLNILNKFFSRNTFRHCYEDGHDKVYGQVIKRYIGCESGKTNLELVSEIYKVLKNEYRNEYYYKNQQRY